MSSRNTLSEQLIKAQLRLDDSHLQSHPNVLLQVPKAPQTPPALEAAPPYRWSIEQLDNLLEVVASAAHVINPDTREIPTQALLTYLTQLTQAPAVEDEADTRQRVNVPPCWRGCEKDRLQNLCNLFDYKPKDGLVDCVELLLHLALMYSPLGWPSLETLLEARRALEPVVPPGASWPDFWIPADVFEVLPLFVDMRGLEADLARRFSPNVAEQPSPFSRPTEQLQWIGRLLRRFPAELREMQAWRLEASWHDYQSRCAAQAEWNSQVLDDVKVSPAESPHGPPHLTGTPLISGTPRSVPLLGSTSGDITPTTPVVRPPRPTEPDGLPERPAPDAINARQLFTYLCVGSSLEDGLTRALSVLGPTAIVGASVPIVDLHAALLQLGARSTPAPVEGDGRPAHPGLTQLLEVLDEDGTEHTQSTTMTVQDFLTHPQVAKLISRLHLGKRHTQAQVEKLFPKNLGARQADSQ